MLARPAHYIVILFLALMVTAASAQTRETPVIEVLSLDQAISLALRDNRQLKNSALEVEKINDRAEAARTRRLPEFKLYTLGSQLLTPVNFTFERGVFGTYPGVGPIPGEETKISTPRVPTAIILGQINQPLSQQYRIGLGLKQLSLGREIAEEQLRAQRQAVINNVKRGYYAMAQIQSALLAVEESVKLMQEIERITGEYLVQQAVLKAETLEVKTRLEKARYEAMTWRDQLATQKEQFNLLLGRDPAIEFSVDPLAELSPVAFDLAAARSRALEQRPEIKEAKLKIQQAENDRQLKKSERIPEVSLTLSYLSPLNFNFVPKNIASVGVSLTWEPFDWGRRKSELAEKGRVIEQAGHGLRDAENQVVIEVGGKYRKLQQARQLLEIGRLMRETAQEKVRVAANRYEARAALLRDVLQEQTALAEADNQYQQALMAFWTARADFEKAIGH